MVGGSAVDETLAKKKKEKKKKRKKQRKGEYPFSVGII